MRDYVLFIDKSGSMAGGRWQEVQKVLVLLFLVFIWILFSKARKAIESLAPQLTKVCFCLVFLFFVLGLNCFAAAGLSPRLDSVFFQRPVHAHRQRDYGRPSARLFWKREARSVKQKHICLFPF